MLHRIEQDSTQAAAELAEYIEDSWEPNHVVMHRIIDIAHGRLAQPVETSEMHQKKRDAITTKLMMICGTGRSLWYPPMASRTQDTKILRGDCPTNTAYQVVQNGAEYLRRTLLPDQDITQRIEDFVLGCYHHVRNQKVSAESNNAMEKCIVSVRQGIISELDSHFSRDEDPIERIRRELMFEELSTEK